MKINAQEHLKALRKGQTPILDYLRESCEKLSGLKSQQFISLMDEFHFNLLNAEIKRYVSGSASFQKSPSGWTKIFPFYCLTHLYYANLNIMVLVTRWEGVSVCGMMPENIQEEKEYFELEKDKKPPELTHLLDYSLLQEWGFVWANDGLMKDGWNIVNSYFTEFGRADIRSIVGAKVMLQRTGHDEWQLSHTMIRDEDRILFVGRIRSRKELRTILYTTLIHKPTPEQAEATIRNITGQR